MNKRDKYGVTRIIAKVAIVIPDEIKSPVVCFLRLVMLINVDTFKAKKEVKKDLITELKNIFPSIIL